MTPTRRRRATALAAALVLSATTALASGAGVSPAAAVPTAPSPTLEPEPPRTDREVATEALAAVRAIFGPSSSGLARARVSPGGADATMALRDLAQHYDSLSARDRELAEAYLARPTDSGGDGGVAYTVPEAPPACTDDVCIHYVTTARARQRDDRPPLTDTQDAAGGAGANGIPDYVDQVLRVVSDVHDTYLRAGYREPKGDGTKGGGDDLVDVYLADVGSQRIYGYCSIDPVPGQTTFADRPAHCVLDNDYQGFRGSALDNIKVTAAHEYFHATQFAYDAFEDQWFMEATATWAEDEVYDDVNDNVQYLRTSPLTAPFVPLDAFVRSGTYDGFHYGTWTFFRFLTETYAATEGGLPRLVLDMWELADGSSGAPDLYSWQAVDAVLRTQRTTAASQFLAFSVANRRPRQTYDEGRAQRYPTSSLRGRVTLTPTRSRTSVTRTRTDHLTSATYRLTPKDLKRPRTKLRVVLDMAPTIAGSMAAITVVPTRGRTKVYPVRLSQEGNGRRAVAFSSRRVRHVEVTMANASARFTDCYRFRTPFSCGGAVARDDGTTQKLSARVLR